MLGAEAGEGSTGRERGLQPWKVGVLSWCPQPKPTPAYHLAPTEPWTTGHHQPQAQRAEQARVNRACGERWAYSQGQVPSHPTFTLVMSSCASVPSAVNRGDNSAPLRHL